MSIFDRINDLIIYVVVVFFIPLLILSACLHNNHDNKMAERRIEEAAEFRANGGYSASDIRLHSLLDCNELGGIKIRTSDGYYCSIQYTSDQLISKVYRLNQ